MNLCAFDDNFIKTLYYFQSKNQDLKLTNPLDYKFPHYLLYKSLTHIFHSHLFPSCIVIFFIHTHILYSPYFLYQHAVSIINTLDISSFIIHDNKFFYSNGLPLVTLYTHFWFSIFKLFKSILLQKHDNYNINKLLTFCITIDKIDKTTNTLIVH